MANNTLKSLLDFAKTSGRVTVSAWGDSTGQRDGYGHAAASFRALCHASYCAGFLVPPNAQAGDSGVTNTLGMYGVRRTATVGTTIGTAFAQDAGGGVGYPTASRTIGYGYSPPSGYTTPLPAFFAVATLSGALGTGGAGTTFDATVAGDAAAFPANPTQHDVRIDNEVIRATRIGTQWTIVSRARFGGINGLDAAAASHSAGAKIFYADNSTNSCLVVDNQHPISLNTNLTAIVAYYAIDPSTYANGTYRSGVSLFDYNLQWFSAIDASMTRDTSAFTPTNRQWNPGSAASGTLILAEQAMSSVNRALKHMIGPISPDISGSPLQPENGWGPFGPACIIGTGYLATARPYGFIQTMK